MDFISLLFVLGVFCSRTESQTVTHSAETNLRSTLATGYDTTVRPSTPTTVYMYYSIKSLKQLDITSQTMSMTAWLTLFWEDPRLAWTTSSYSNIDQLDVNFAWRPEFGIVNSVDNVGFYGADSSTTRLRVFNTGMVRWLQFMGTDTQCEMDITNFPYDTQTCDVEIVFWGSSTSDITINVTMDTINTMRYSAHSEWELQSTSTHSMDVQFCCPASTHKMMNFRFVYKRLRPYYIMNIIVPSILLSICSVWVFYLPTDSGERLGFSLTILLAYTVQMSITSALMPTTSQQIPNIAMYLLIVMVLCTMLLCNVVLHVKIFFKEDDPPVWVKKLYRKGYPMVFCLKRPGNKVEDSVNVAKITKLVEEDLTCDPVHPGQKMAIDVECKNESKDNVKEDDDITWVKVSKCMDRLCFFFYLFMTLILNIVFVIQLHLN